jgi:TetR/AcrR family transcriptional repressor of nem operon
MLVSYLTIQNVLAAYESTKKRSALVYAASELLHEQGYRQTTLADVAARARVPLGNVHYYFKTKEELGEAVIAAHEAALGALLNSYTDAHADPARRLRCFIRMPLDAAPRIVQFGCPHGSLCQELEKLGSKSRLARSATRLLRVHLEWTTAQFVALGRPSKEARSLAEQLVAAVQGTMLVAQTLRSAVLLRQQLRRVEQWLNEVAERTAP